MAVSPDAKISKKRARQALDSFRKLCIEYDKRNGAYPESQYEGRSVFLFIADKLGIEIPSLNHGKEYWLDTETESGQNNTTD